MHHINAKIFEKKVIINIHNRICEDGDELVNSSLFGIIVKSSLEELQKRKSILLNMFENPEHFDKNYSTLLEIFKYIHKMPISLIPKLVEGSDHIVKNHDLFFNYVEFLYNYWRSYNRFILCSSLGEDLDKRPYRTFNETIEQLTHLVRKVYRDIQENITNDHPNVYRQVRAGAEFASIAIEYDIPMPEFYKKKLGTFNIIRQILLNPPVVLDPPMNKRTGEFIRVNKNPFDRLQLNPEEWICYPAKVGPLVILIYIYQRFYELGFSLANLFEIATDADLNRKPDGIYLYGVDKSIVEGLGKYPTVFYDDLENDMVVAFVPNNPEFGYFGYLKKMVLTLHNVKMMKLSKMPFHGSLTTIRTKDGKESTILLIGDTGAGKSETLEAFRVLGQNFISDIIIIADDMGSLDINENGEIIGYGTEIGAFLRLDDLSPGVAFGQIDRAIFMSASQVNARIVIPVTSLHHVLKGTKIDFILYANNYEQIDENHPIIEKFTSAEQAIEVFRKGAVMSKGTTTSTGLVHSYYANIFGPTEYISLHDEIAQKYFKKMFENGIFVGQMRTRLGLKGYEFNGPLESAKELIKMINKQ